MYYIYYMVRRTTVVMAIALMLTGNGALTRIATVPAARTAIERKMS